MYSIGIGITGGFGDGSKYYNSGVNLSFNGFLPLNDRVYVGGRISNVHLSQNKDNPSKGISGFYYAESFNIFELIPSVRYVAYSFGGKSPILFMQSGFGLYDITYEINDYGWEYKSTKSRLGINIGMGFIVGGNVNVRFEFYPSINIIFNENENIKYYSITFSALFN